MKTCVCMHVSAVVQLTLSVSAYDLSLGLSTHLKVPAEDCRALGAAEQLHVSYR